VIATRLHHVSLPVKEIERSRRFYGELLGLEEIPRPDFPFPGAWYRLGPCEVHLIQPPPKADVGTRPSRTNPMAGHAAFAIEDYVKVRDQLRARGVELLETSPEAGQMWLRDPDGNVIELICRS
jgi:catechol 2,3-dioxygenase-like lactoylglutathione lyase family enzyme